MTDAQQPPLVEPATVSVGRPLGSSIEECVRELATLLADASRISDTDAFVADVMAREAKGATVLPGGVALPHARSAAATVSSLAVARLPEPVQLADGEPTDLIFLIAVPGDAADRYLTILREVSRAVVRPAFRDACREAHSPQTLASLAAQSINVR